MDKWLIFIKTMLLLRNKRLLKNLKTLHPMA